MAQQDSTQTTFFTARNIILMILPFAIGISGYLSYLKVTSAAAACVQGAAFDCGTVLNSSYSELVGIPIAWLGLGINLMVLILLVLESRIGFVEENGPVMVFGLLLFATLFSIWLVIVQAFLIKAYCPWCLTHEVLVFTMFGFSIHRLRQALAFE